MKKSKKFAGFSLVEVLVVIVIMSILSSSIMVAAGGKNVKKARDSIRKSDLSQISRALDTYYVDHGSYPPDPALDSGTEFKSETGGNSWIPGLAPDQIKIVPKDPKQAQILHYLANFFYYWRLNQLQFIQPKPVLASTANLGYQGIGGSSLVLADVMRVSRVSVPASEVGSVSSGYGYVSGGSSSGVLYLVVYADNAGVPGSLIGASNSAVVFPSTSPQWRTFAFSSSFNVTAGQVLWLGFYGDQTNSGASVYYAGSQIGDYSGTGHKFRSLPSPPIPNPFGSASNSNQSRYWSAFLVVDLPEPSPSPSPTPTPTPSPTPSPSPSPTPTPTPSPTPTPTPTPSPSPSPPPPEPSPSTPPSPPSCPSAGSTEHIYVYCVLENRQKWVLWAVLEDTNDDLIYTKNPACGTATGDLPSEGTDYNYCIRSQ